MLGSSPKENFGHASSCEKIHYGYNDFFLELTMTCSLEPGVEQFVDIDMKHALSQSETRSFPGNVKHLLHGICRLQSNATFLPFPSRLLFLPLPTQTLSFVLLPSLNFHIFNSYWFSLTAIFAHIL